MKDSNVQNYQEQIPRAIEQTLDDVSRVSEIVNAMTEFSQPFQEMTLVDLNGAIRNTVMLASNEWNPVAKMKLDLDPDLHPVNCLPGEFNQVILSIIVNAAHAVGDVLGDAPQERGSISISTKQLDDWVEIRVTDAGIGMPEDVKAHVFDPFFTTKKNGKSSGQGLSVAYAVIVEKHAGTIKVDSTPGQGSCFTIRLPITELQRTDATAVA